MATPEPGGRYAVQVRVERLGPAGQARLGRSAALVVGVGALGSAIAHQLVRAGLGRVTLVDGDRVETSNLHRQVLYTEEDARLGRAKAEAAAERLAEANGEVELRAVVGRFDGSTAAGLLAGVDVLLDGTDDLRTRYLIDSLCHEASVPWVYGGVAGTHGMVMPIVPGRTACLRCLFDEPPAAEPEVSSAEAFGVLGPAPAVVGALQAAAALRILAGGFEPPSRLTTVDVWTGEADSIVVRPMAGCPLCGGPR